MRASRLFLTLIVIIGVISFYISGVEREPVEKVSISSAIGYDLGEDLQGNLTRYSTISLYNLSENEKSSRPIVTEGKTLGETREDRQRKIDKKFLLGFEKVYIIGENYAENGIQDILDILFRTPEVRDSSYVCVCKNKAEDIIKMPIEGYASSGDFIEGLIRYSKEYNFFPGNYKLIDCYLRIDAEGRNLALPYIQIKEGTVEIAGVAVFKKSKMVDIVPMRDAKILNLLRENDIMGMLTIEDSPKKFVNYYGKSRRKVKCYKEGDKYRFVINLRMVGDLVANEYGETLINSPEEKEMIERKLEKSLEDKAENFITEIQNDYKVDLLELGRVAAAKYGRKTGVDWDDIVSNSVIEVKAAIEIDRYGRGDY